MSLSGNVPRENESLNETWLPDRDRYSQQGLYSDDRVLEPQVKENGEWKTVSWDEAIETLATRLRESLDRNGPEQLGVLMSPSAPTEDYFLAQSLLRQLGGADHILGRPGFRHVQADHVGVRQQLEASEAAKHARVGKPAVILF